MYFNTMLAQQKNIKKLPNESSGIREICEDGKEKKLHLQRLLPPVLIASSN